MDAGPERVTIDGAREQGGGQSLRVALFLSTLLQQPLEFINIRAGRPKPGLRPQHLHTLRTVRDITDAELEGDAVGAEEIRFRPSTPRSGAYVSDPGTAGSITLMLQTLLPIMAVTPGRTELRLRGGTDVAHAPPWDWFEQVYLHWLRPVFNTLDVEVVRRGFYPAGGGEVHVVAESSFETIPDLDRLRAHLDVTRGAARIEPGNWKAIHGMSIGHAALAEHEVTERQAHAARRALAATALPGAAMRERYVETRSKGTALALWAEDEDGGRIGGDALGAPGKPAETVGEEAARSLIEDIEAGGVVDRHMADHLVPWIALGSGPVRIPQTTEHVEDALRLVGRFLPRGTVVLKDHVLSHDRET